MLAMRGGCSVGVRRQPSGSGPWTKQQAPLLAEPSSGSWGKNDLISKKSKCGKHLRVFPGYVGPEVGIFLTTQIPPPQVMADAPIIIKLYYNVRCLKYQKAHDCALSFRLQ